MMQQAARPEMKKVGEGARKGRDEGRQQDVLHHTSWAKCQMVSGKGEVGGRTRS